MGKADMIISVEPMESLRYLPIYHPTGWLITNTKPYINIRNYPSMDNLIAEIESLPNQVSLDADEIAKELGSPKSANMVILGAACPFLVYHTKNCRMQYAPFSHVKVKKSSI
jgi:indolepyruvate ferredoxin oxidoreductase, beta subunit